MKIQIKYCTGHNQIIICTCSKQSDTFTKGSVFLCRIRNKGKKNNSILCPFSQLCVGGEHSAADSSQCLTTELHWCELSSAISPGCFYLAPTPSLLFRSNRQSVCSYYPRPGDGQLINYNCAAPLFSFLFFFFQNFLHLLPLCP